MKFLCSFCNIQCKSTSGLVQHTRLKHNFRTRHQSLDLSNREEETEPSSKRPRTIVNSENEDSYNLDYNSENIEDNSEFNNLDLSESSDHEPETDDLIIYEPTGGTIYDSEESLERHNEFIAKLGWAPESDANNLLHPWKHEGEIWLTDLLFRDGNISQGTADKLLHAFATGKISMADGPIQFTNSREMLKLVDIASGNKTVCSNIVRVNNHSAGTSVLMYLFLFSPFKAKFSTSRTIPKHGLVSMKCSFEILLQFCKS